MRRKFVDRKRSDFHLPARKKPPKKPKGAGGRRANLKKSARRSAELRQDLARSGKINGADIRKGGESTGRETGIMASHAWKRKKREEDIQQSVGSLDRRINKAIAEGNTALAKDLRSRQNKFTKKLALERAHKAMINAAPLALRSKMYKRIRANPNMLNTRGKEIFDLTTQADFIDSTRRLQNVYPKQMAKMYPLTSLVSKGGLGSRIAQKIFGGEDKDIPYRYPDMDNMFGEGAFPAQRYALDRGFNAGKGEIKTPISLADLSYTPEKDWGPDVNYDDPDIIMAGQEPEEILSGKEVITDKDKQAAIDRGISPEFIFPVDDDPETDIIEQDMNTGSALQLAEAANVKGSLNELIENIDPEWMRDKKKNTWFEGAPTNVFALPDTVKEELNKTAAENVKEYELETYGKEITSEDLAKANINEAWYNQNPDTPIVQQALLNAGIITKDMVDPEIAKQNKNLEVKKTSDPKTKTLSDFYEDITWQNAVKGGKNVVDKAAYWSGADAIADALTWGTDKVLKKTTGWEPWSEYTGEEWTNKIAADKELALQAIADAGLSDEKKTSLVDFVNRDMWEPTSILPDSFNPILSAGTSLPTNTNFNTQVYTDGTPIPNTNFDTEVGTDQASIDILNSLAEESDNDPTFLQKLWGAANKFGFGNR